MPAKSTQRTPKFVQPQVIADINITPLIDVMLVLLVMIIITVPIMTHKVPVEMPGAGPIVGGPSPVIHRLDINASGHTMWDGQRVSKDKLILKLEALAKDPAEPQLRMSSDPSARYEHFAQTIATVKRAGVTRLGFVGNDKFVKWH